MTQVHISTNGRHGYGTLDGFTEVTLPLDMDKDGDGARQLYLINNLLAEQRKKAWDHERGGEMFHGAALIRTRTGKYYMAANIHLQNPKTTRNCAEANAATSAVNAEGIDMEITDLWFMGGKGDLARDIEIVPGDVGRRNTPCGSCLDVIWNSRLGRIHGALDGETLVHMLPLNAGDRFLQADDGRPLDQLAPDQVMTRSISQLLPHVSYGLPDGNGRIKATVRAGWELLNEPLTGKALDAAMQSQALVRLNHMQDAPKKAVLAEVNALMVDTLHALAERSKAPLKSARVAVVRMDNGEFYMGVSLDNGYTTAMQPAESDAIQAALKTHPTDHAITDMFVMAVDFEKMPGQLAAWEKQPDADIAVRTPDGSERARLSKASARSTQKLPDIMGNITDRHSGASVHIMLLNDKEHFDPSQHIVSMTVRDLLPYRFVSPKMDLQQIAGVRQQ